MTDIGLTDQQLAETIALLDDIERHKKYNRYLYFVPYPKQRAFFNATATFRETMFQAGNRVGKSYGGAYMAMCHATGLYPDDWEGKKFEFPTRGWVASPTGELSRDVAQTHLCGPANIESLRGTGMIPRDRMGQHTLGHGVTGAYDTLQVKHTTNGIEDGISVINFKSYVQGRDKFQGDDIDWGWGDEAPGDMELYSEFLTRVNLGGILFLTATPYDKYEIAKRFEEKSPNRTVIHMDYREVPGLTPEQIKLKMDGYLPHERAARMSGTILMGAGRVFDGISEEMITEPWIENIPRHWYAIWGLDFGIGHPFGAVLLLWDKDNDVVHVRRAIRMQGMQPTQHAEAIKTSGGEAPVAWPQDGTQRDKGSGLPLSRIYKGKGLWLRQTHATLPEGGYSTEAGIALMYQRMASGKFKVGSDCAEWFEEFRYYSRDKNAQIVKEHDDLMSATRTAIIDLRFARQGAMYPGGPSARNSGSVLAKGVDFDLD